MTIEHVKAFGTWLSNMLYWVLEPVFGGEDSGEAPESMEADFEDPLTATYASKTEALACGGAGIDIGGGAYI